MKHKKNILIISPFFYPEPISTGKYNTDLALALSKEGHEVTVLCFHPFYPDWKIKKSNKQLERINIIRGGSALRFSKKTIIRRFVLELGFAFFILRKIKTVQKNKDIIIPIFPPSFAFYSILSFLNKKVKKVGIVHDLQEVYSAEKKGFLNRIVKFFIHKIEKKCFKSCHRILFLSNEMKREAKKIYNLEEDKLEVQYPFINIKDSITNELESLFDKQKVNIVYSGALGEKQNPFKLYNFFKEASNKNEMQMFYFFSEGDVFKKLKKTNINPKIKFYNLVNKENLEELYSLSDVQIVPQKENTSKGSLPSKLPNLLASTCKVLVITDPNSELEKLFKNNNLDKIVTSWKTDVLIDSLDKLINKKVDFTHQKKTARNLFTIDKMIQKVLR